MKCKHVQQQMLAYSEKLLDKNAQSRIEEHVQTCATCAQELGDIEQTLDLLQSVPSPEPPEPFWTDFTSGLMSKIHQMESPSAPRHFFVFPRFKMAIAVFALIGLIGGLCVYFYPDIQQFLDPEKITAELPGQGYIPPTSPGMVDLDDTIETALRRIASEDLTQDMLAIDLALFDGTTTATFDLDYSEEMLYSLIDTLTEEEKKALLSELYKMKEISP